MPQTLIEYLTELYNPEVFYKYLTDPDALIRESDLSARHKELLRSGNASDILAAVQAEDGEALTAASFMVAHVVSCHHHHDE